MQTTNPKLSIVIPVFNGEQFIHDAYNSIQRQQLQCEFEILFVDNNSTDNSTKIISKIVEKASNVRLLSETKQGAGAARNKGCEEAKGLYIYFFDIDDLLFDNILNRFISILDTHPEVDSVFGNLTREKQQLTEQSEDIPPLQILVPPKQGLFWFTYFAKLVGPPCFMHRKEVINNIGGFAEEIKVGEDAAFHIRLGTFCTLGYVNTNVYYYHRHDNSTVSKSNELQERLYIYWEQYVKHYIPFSHAHVWPDEFYELLKRKVFSSLSKIVQRESNYKNRREIFDRLKIDIKPLKLPWWLNICVYIIALTGSKLIQKVALRLIIRRYKLYGEN